MIRLISTVVAVSFLAGAAPALSQPARESASDDVPPQAAARARGTAEASTRLRAALADPRGTVVFVGVDLVRQKGEGEREPPPLYRVRHYRVADDTTITSLVDPSTGAVVEQVEARNVAVALSESELEDARRLAFADGRVREAIGESFERITVEPLVVRTSDRNDPWFGRRIVRLLFRVGTDYLSNPVVYVDLTRRQVIVQPPHRPDHGGSR